MRNQGTQESLDYGRSSGTTGQVKREHCVCYLISFLMTVIERDIAKMIAEVEATSWRI